MGLHALLRARAAAGRPVRAAIVGAGKFATMWLAQVPATPGLHVVAIADLSPDRARAALGRAGWPAERIAARSISDAARGGGTFVGDDALAAIAAGEVDVVVEATGDPAAGVRHALACAAHGKHVVMVNVEADALCGPLLARRVREAGALYSLAWGDQPALVCDLVDGLRASGFRVVAAGKGTKFLPRYHASTPETVWEEYGLDPAAAAAQGLSARMFNSFLDGTKSAIEMAAVSNASGLTPAPDGLAFPPCGVDDLPRVLRPRSAGGQLHHAGQVEVISSVERDGRPVFRDLRWGVYVTFSADSEYVRRCFKEYGLVTDDSGNCCAMYKPYHLIGLELGISVASVALRREPTGCATDFRGDVVATAKRDLTPGDTLDGEGGYTVYGKLMPATDSLSLGGLPLGLAHRVKLKRPVAAGKPILWSDVEMAEGEAVRFRREMEATFAAELGLPIGKCTAVS
jgi:predicted homoserine dehydrogenase-like protein